MAETSFCLFSEQISSKSSYTLDQKGGILGSPLRDLLSLWNSSLHLGWIFRLKLKLPVCYLAKAHVSHFVVKLYLIGHLVSFGPEWVGADFSAALLVLEWHRMGFLSSPIMLQIGGTEEYKICRGIKEGRLTKPVVCWCIGTCATMFSSEVW
jgi:hypothetical protein